MPLGPGSRFGPYEVISALGAGGMGEVYKARDTRLDRTVAIKVLPDAFASDPDLRQRFEREARAIAALNHPHICTLHDIGHEPAGPGADDGRDYLVLEYLDGETLAARLEEGPLPLDQAMTYAIEIADALDRAHRDGIVHRDLKPGNVMLTKSGTKLLDFGLARSSQPAVTTTVLSMLPTTPPNLTAQGAILGTFQYMAPEQIEGLEADARTDIFAFGALLHEMLTGRRAFEGKSQATLLAAILERTPAAVSSSQPLVSPALDHLVSRCLAKSPEDRWQAASDVMRELQWITRTPASPAPVTASRLLSLTAGALLGALGSLALGFLLWLMLKGKPSEPAAVRFHIVPPSGVSFEANPPLSPFAISPDGRALAFIAASPEGQHLWVQSLDSFEARKLNGTDNAQQPFWSPDSRSIAYIAQTQLKRVDASGGPPQTICICNAARGGSWNKDGTILFSGSPTQSTSSILRVVASGGSAEPLKDLAQSSQSIPFGNPRFLSDGRSFLYPAGTPGASDLRRGWLDGRPSVRIPGIVTTAAVASGYILFARERTLVAQPFDEPSGQLTGEPVVVADRVDVRGRIANFSVSDNGVLAYRQLSDATRSPLQWRNRSGAVLGELGTASDYTGLAISPDGSRVAASRPNENSVASIWVIDVARNLASPLRPPESRIVNRPTWSPDGREIAFVVSEGSGIVRKKPAAGGAETTVFGPDPQHVFLGTAGVTDWSGDGRYLLLTWTNVAASDAKANYEIGALPLSGDKTPISIVKSQFELQRPRFSPDGHWVAYTSNETGSTEVFVTRFPPTGEQSQISGNGGVQPRWRGDGKELFYLARTGTVMAVDIKATDHLDVGAARGLFQSGLTTVTGVDQYAVSADGQRFLVMRSDFLRSNGTITVVVNWPSALRK